MADTANKAGVGGGGGENNNTIASNLKNSLRAIMFKNFQTKFENKVSEMTILLQNVPIKIIHLFFQLITRSTTNNPTL